MSDSIVLSHLRAIRADIAGLKEDVADVRRRLSSIEGQVGRIASTEQEHFAILVHQSDRWGERMTRIEQRLELTDAYDEAQDAGGEPDAPPPPRIGR